MPLPNLRLRIRFSSKQETRRPARLIGNSEPIIIEAEDRDTGQALDVTGLAVKLFRPGGANQNFLQGQLTPDGVGRWLLYTLLDESGTWVARATCVAPVQARARAACDVLLAGEPLPDAPRPPILIDEEERLTYTPEGEFLDTEVLSRKPAVADLQPTDALVLMRGEQVRQVPGSVVSQAAAQAGEQAVLGTPRPPRAVLAGPAAGDPAPPSFRELDASDVKVQQESAPLARPTQIEFRETLKITQYGYQPGSGADAGPALRWAIAKALADGRRSIRAPAGDYLLASGHPTNPFYATDIRGAGVVIEGDGEDITTFRVADGANVGILSWTDCQECGFGGLTLDGNGGNQTVVGLHTARFDNCESMFAWHFKSNRANNYALGVQVGAFRRFHVERGVIEDCYADGIDFKNHEAAPGNPGGIDGLGNFDVKISKLLIKNWGKRKNDQYVGIDMRGIGDISDITVVLTEDSPYGRYGVRARSSDTTPWPTGQGWGGRYSQISGITGIALGVTSLLDFLVSIDDPHVLAGGLRAGPGWPNGVLIMPSSVESKVIGAIFEGLLANGVHNLGTKTTIAFSSINNCGAAAIRLQADTDTKISHVDGSGNEYGIRQMPDSNGMTLLNFCHFEGNTSIDYGLQLGKHRAVECRNYLIDHVIQSGGQDAILIERVTNAANLLFVRPAAAGGIVRLMPGGTAADLNVPMGIYSRGNSLLALGTNGGASEVLRIVHVDSVVNRWEMKASVAGLPLQLYAGGADADVALYLGAKGAAAISLCTNTLVPQARVLDTASAVNFLTLTGAAAGAAPRLAVEGSDANIPLSLASKGTGAVKLFTGTNEALRLNYVASAVNFPSLKGSTAGQVIEYGAEGADTNIPARLTSKGASFASLCTNGGLNEVLRANHTANMVNGWTIQGSAAGGSIQLLARGTDANISLVLTAKGTGLISASNPIQLPTYTVAGLPAAASYPRCLAYVSDGTGNKRLAICDGAAWRWPDGAVVS